MHEKACLISMFYLDLFNYIAFTSQSTMFQSCQDVATASSMLTSTMESLQFLTQGHYKTEVGIKPKTPCSHGQIQVGGGGGGGTVGPDPPLELPDY